MFCHTNTKRAYHYEITDKSLPPNSNESNEMRINENREKKVKGWEKKREENIQKNIHIFLNTVFFKIGKICDLDLNAI